jgi:lipopolysaccharide/colanic/teichoic acid biosynthesis glycosyltransferase
LLKGDLKIVGVRPLSLANFSTYPQYLQDKRTKVKPGLIPPMYADLPKTKEEFYRSEERYLDSYLNSPLKTDVKYFFKAIYNIIFKKARSH